uniref:Transmembrane protein n=1 Tax=Noctiluca scintillans TaxID=2966 RepID=A0A7S1ATK6_NOCSC|mmetsp:Transcript_59115/g.157311  ORF Transcript_59115/g.157311 Transcript_59115/m.157311 type:complete len:144 (+) Transcript_59115:50-481(+)
MRRFHNIFPFLLCGVAAVKTQVGGSVEFPLDVDPNLFASFSALQSQASQVLAADDCDKQALLKTRLRKREKLRRNLTREGIPVFALITIPFVLIVSAILITWSYHDRRQRAARREALLAAKLEEEVFEVPEANKDDKDVPAEG